MFKKSKIVPNEYDTSLDKLLDARIRASSVLSSHVLDLIIKKNVVDLYPEGPDRQRAFKDYRSSQNLLLCYIADYDDIYSKLMNFDFSKCAVYSTNERQFETATSHKIIEIAYRNFYRK